MGSFSRATVADTEPMPQERAYSQGWATFKLLLVTPCLWCMYWQGLDTRFLVGAIIATLGTVVAVIGLCTGGRQQRQVGGPACWADGHQVGVKLHDDIQEAAWADLLRVEHHGDDAILCFTLDRQLRLPRRKEFAPVLEVASHIAALRAEHDDALQERMARGLSRPETDARAERGLSVVE